MVGEMDRFCTLIVVIGAIILIFMGCNEVSRMRVRDRSINTCGMRAATKTSAGADDDSHAKSARKSFAKPQHANDINNAFESTNEVPEKEYIPLTQDDKILKKLFIDTATDEEKLRFDQHKVDKEQVLQKANTRAITRMSHMDVPTHSKRLGMPNPLLTLRDTCNGKKEEPTFGATCTWFNGTEAYYDARLTAGSEACKLDCKSD